MAYQEAGASANARAAKATPSAAPHLRAVPEYDMASLSGSSSCNTDFEPIPEAEAAAAERDHEQVGLSVVTRHVGADSC